MTAVDPQLMTVATLTGHACLAVGQPYSIILDNGPARARRVAQRVQQAGDAVGDLFEISTVRREDYEFHKGVDGCPNLPKEKPLNCPLTGSLAILI